MQITKQFLGLFCLILLISLVFVDARSHFSANHVKLIRKNQSAQKHWNLYYGQNYVYADSSFRYEKDLAQISLLVDGDGVLSDKATSYYLAATADMYAVNIHRHHGARYSQAWKALIKENQFCESYSPDKRATLKKYLAYQKQRPSTTSGGPSLKYIVVNTDVLNKNVRLDCLWQRREALIDNVKGVSNLVFQGAFLNLYEINLDLE